MFFGSTDHQDTTVVGLIVSSLRRDISFGLLAPDSKLKIGDLRIRYGGSNHSVREALRILASEGLVEAIAQRGFRVASASEHDLRDISDVRKEIEVIGLRRSIENGDLGWEGRVIAAHHALGKIEELVASEPSDLNALEWDESVRTLFATLVAACGSPRLIEMQRKYFDQSRRIRLAALREGRLDFNARAERRQAIVEAILKRNAHAACVALVQDIEIELTGENSSRPLSTKKPEETYVRN